MILQQFGYKTFKIDTNFEGVGYRTVGRVEVTIFNCPQWGTGVQSIQVTQSYQLVHIVYPTVLSCESLLKVCIPLDHNKFITRFQFSFTRFSGAQQKVHIAEIAFYNGSLPCPLFTTIPGAWSPPQQAKSKHCNCSSCKMAVYLTEDKFSTFFN